MSKIGIYTDFHLHLWKSFGRDADQGLPVRFLEQCKVLDEMYETFKREKVSVVINGGDTFHKDSDVPTECINKMTEFVDKIHLLGAKQIWCQGNHDISNKKTPTWLNTTYWPLENKYKCDCEDIKEAKVRMIWYTEDYIDLVKGYDIVIVHKQPILTNKFGYTYEGIDWKTLANNNRLVFFGHYHENKQLSENCWIMGPPMHLTFGDEGQRGVWIVDTEDWSVKCIKMNYPDFITVETADKVKDDGNYYRVLNSKTKVDSDRVVTAVIPEVFEERIKSDDFVQILSEWVTINKKAPEFLDAIIPVAKQKMQSAKDVFSGKIASVEIHDFFSIGKIEYRVENGFHIVTGKNADFDSNGSGKTSLFEAIYWCFFGKTTKGNLRSDEIIRDGHKDCKVVVKLESGGREKTGYFEDYEITRTKKDGLVIRKTICSSSGDRNDVDTIELTEGKTKPERENMLLEVLGFDEKVYLASCYFSQENIMMLTGLGDADRTNMITDLLGFEKYDDLHEIAKGTSEENRKNLAQFEMDVSTINGDIKWIQESIYSSQKRVVEVQESINDKTIMAKKKSEEAKVLAEQINALVKPNIDVSEIDDKIQKIESVLVQDKLKLRDKNRELSTNDILLKGREKQCNDIKNEFDYHKRDRERLVSELSEAENIDEKDSTKTCSSCGSVITLKNKTHLIETLKKKIEAVNPSLIKLKEQYASLKKECDSFKAISDEHLKSVNELEARIEEVNDKLRKANSMKSNLLVQTKDYEVQHTSLVKQLSAVQNVISTLGVDINNFELDKIKATKELDANKLKMREREEKIEQIKKDFFVCQKNIEIWEFWREAFSSTGIRSVLLDRFCNEFNVILNQYLSLISNGVMSIVVSPTKKTGSGAERNKIGITINNNAMERNYLALSGGEKRRVDVSLCMGLNKWVSSKYHIREGLLGIIILDELFSFVDRLGEESIAGLLYNEGSHRAIFVISHTPDISSYTRNIWTVVKEKGVSSLQIAEG